MKVKFKNPEEFKEFLIQSGHSLRSFSKVIGKKYCYIGTITKRNALSPQSANLICKTLDKTFDDIFFIEVSTDVNKQPA